MEILNNIFLIFIGVIFFSLIILIHEFGHFFTAKLSGVCVNEFALGMGPKLLAFKRGETLYSLRALPIGGFCAMEGEDEESDQERAFGKAPVWKRMIIIVTGALLNIFLGFVLTFVLLLQQPYFSSTIIEKFDKNVSGQQALQVGDRLMAVNGYRIYTSGDFGFALSINILANNNAPMQIEVKRNGEKVTLNDVKFDTEKLENGEEVPKLNFFTKKVDKNLGTLIVHSVKSTISTTRTVWKSLSLLITGKIKFKTMAGPLGIMSSAGKAASEGLKQDIGVAINNIIRYMMLITINLGIVNLLPIPSLDGSRFVFLLIEAIRGKPIKPKYEGIIHTVGFMLVIALMLILTFNDVFKLVRGS